MTLHQVILIVNIDNFTFLFCRRNESTWWPRTFFQRFCDKTMHWNERNTTVGLDKMSFVWVEVFWFEPSSNLIPYELNLHFSLSISLKPSLSSSLSLPLSFYCNDDDSVMSNEHAYKNCHFSSFCGTRQKRMGMCVSSPDILIPHICTHDSSESIMTNCYHFIYAACRVFYDLFKHFTNEPQRWTNIRAMLPNVIQIK